MNKKGFIGAIGDDFPSLIPLFFAILIFFSSLTYAFTTINDKNAYINTYLDSLKIAKTALGNGMYSGYEDFVDKTDNILSTSNYVIGIVYRENDDEYLSEYKLDTLDLEDTFVCEDEDYLILKSNAENKTISKRDNELSTQNCYNAEKIYLDASPSAMNLLESDKINLAELSRYQKVFTYIYPIGLMTPKGVVTAFVLVVVW
jgi:hypothetical protein